LAFRAFEFKEQPMTEAEKQEFESLDAEFNPARFPTYQAWVCQNNESGWSLVAEGDLDTCEKALAVAAVVTELILEGAPRPGKEFNSIEYEMETSERRRRWLELRKMER
jgi:hypothetical protein